MPGHEGGISRGGLKRGGPKVSCSPDPFFYRCHATVNWKVRGKGGILQQSAPPHETANPRFPTCTKGWSRGRRARGLLKPYRDALRSPDKKKLNLRESIKYSCG